MIPRNLRNSFQIPTKDVIQWFPGHMGKGLKQMQQKLKLIDCIIEVHDARIPLSGRNPDFKYTVSGLKPHILVLNKKDLTDSRYHRKIAEQIQRDEGIQDVVFTNSKDPLCKGIKSLVPRARELISNSNRFHRTETADHTLMVIGVPNVGKSSLINVLRNRHLRAESATRVGAVAGITRSVLNKIKMSEDPLMYLLDTPGILTPNVKDVETGMKLALCSCLQDHLVGPQLIADYMLYWLNRNQEFEYVDRVGLSNPTDNIVEVLVSCAKMFNKYRKVKMFEAETLLKPDLDSAAHLFLKMFRLGDLGHFNLDNHLFPFRV
ncbi:mitochondrial GTPase 1 [Bradysia coprophila]|uniref:mitochondrial GTPase 1 n=1 Tax=Bradysia coprophila TaxID=38358 RepID=UPI00187DC55D|nr:mitochondrial GTPase 1 [Bradysia coprophila]